jgi:hypothetical protein
MKNILCGSGCGLFKVLFQLIQELSEEEYERTLTG